MQVFAAHGSEAASLRMIADTAGVSLGQVQHHFGTKGALIEAVDQELIAILMQAARRHRRRPILSPTLATD